MVPLWCSSHTLNCIIQSIRHRHWRRQRASCSWKRTMKTCRWRRPRGSGSSCAGSALPAGRCWSSRWSYSEGSSGPSLAPSPPAGTQNLGKKIELESLEKRIGIIGISSDHDDTLEHRFTMLVLENPSRVLCHRLSEGSTLHSENWPLIWFWSSVCTARVHTSPPAGSCSERPSGSPSQHARGTALWDLSKGEPGKPQRHVRLSD